MASSNPNSTSSSSSAPLPSPSASQPSYYFPSYPQLHRPSNTLQQSQAPNSQSQSQSQSQTQSQPQPQQQQQQQLQQQPGQAQQYGHDPSQGKSKDFCLVTEAAKRAQMACLLRDMGEVGL